MSGTRSAATRPTVVVVTGLSGAGKSTALRALEDLGFFCVDNLPTVLAPQAVEACERGGMRRVALGMDVRVGSFLAQVGAVLANLSGTEQRELHLLFLDASDEALLRRFSETRRPHPLRRKLSEAEPRSALAVLDGIAAERSRLSSLRARATRVIDTTTLSVHDLRRAVIAQFGPASGGAPRMLTRVVSFGFKYGAPVDADIVFDVRFIDNPYFVPELRPLRGTDPAVRDYVLSRPETPEFLRRMLDLLRYVVPKYELEGKSYLTVAIGCTGGRHRSVALTEAIASDLRAALHGSVTAEHRDIGRIAERGAATDSAADPSAPSSRCPAGDAERSTGPAPAREGTGR